MSRSRVGALDEQLGVHRGPICIGVCECDQVQTGFPILFAKSGEAPDLPEPRGPIGGRSVAERPFPKRFVKVRESLRLT
jgi:hypothetical protein